MFVREEWRCFWAPARFPIGGWHLVFVGFGNVCVFVCVLNGIQWGPELQSGLVADTKSLIHVQSGAGFS